MVPFAYTLSPTLRTYLEQVGNLRRELLLTMLSPKQELRLRWEARVNRIYFLTKLSRNDVTKQEIVDLLTTPVKRRLTPAETDIVRFRRVLSCIEYEWLLPSKPITVKAIETLVGIVLPEEKIAEKEMREILAYGNANRDHPIIIAALSCLEFSALREKQDILLPLLITFLFLSRYGYDFRGMIVLEEYITKNRERFEEITQEAVKSHNSNSFLEFFLSGILIMLQSTLSHIASHRNNTDLPVSFWELNDRQKEILVHLSYPGSTITNRKVQYLFRVSQITASRDLAKLVNLNLLYARGKGRSIYYTRT